MISILDVSQPLVSSGVEGLDSKVLMFLSWTDHISEPSSAVRVFFGAEEYLNVFLLFFPCKEFFDTVFICFYLSSQCPFLMTLVFMLWRQTKMYRSHAAMRRNAQKDVTHGMDHWECFASTWRRRRIFHGSNLWQSPIGECKIIGTFWCIFDDSISENIFFQNFDHQNDLNQKELHSFGTMDFFAEFWVGNFFPRIPGVKKIRGCTCELLAAGTLVQGEYWKRMPWVS